MLLLTLYLGSTSVAASCSEPSTPYFHGPIMHHSLDFAPSRRWRTRRPHPFESTWSAARRPSWAAPTRRRSWSRRRWWRARRHGRSCGTAGTSSHPCGHKKPGKGWCQPFGPGAQKSFFMEQGRVLSTARCAKVSLAQDQGGFGGLGFTGWGHSSRQVGSGSSGAAPAASLISTAAAPSSPHTICGSRHCGCDSAGTRSLGTCQCKFWSRLC